MNHKELRVHEYEQTRATITYIAGYIVGYRTTNPDMGVVDVLDMLDRLGETYLDSIHEALLDEVED